MEKNMIKCLVVSMISILLVSCGKIDSNRVKNEYTDNNTGSSAEHNSSSDADDESTEEISSTNEGFYYVELKYDEEKNIDIGNDGKTDSLVLNNDDDDYTLKINNDQVIDFMADGGACEDVGVYFVHKTDGDYLLEEREGFSNLTDVTLYTWNSGVFEKTDRLENVAIYMENNTTILEDHIVICGYFDAFGSWLKSKDYSYDKNGFSTTDERYKILPFFGDMGMDALTLKRTLTFYDENRLPQNTLGAGQKIIPYEVSYDEDSDDKNFTMSFVSEKGDFLGYITYDYVQEGEYDRPTAIVDGISEEELFDKE